MQSFGLLNVHYNVFLSDGAGVGGVHTRPRSRNPTSSPKNFAQRDFAHNAMNTLRNRYSLFFLPLSAVRVQDSLT
jgi:hypothetical protein